MFLLDYPDADKISAYADEAMHWVVMHEILTGTDKGVKWLNSLDEGKGYVQAIELLTDFHSPKDAYGTWETDQEYTDYQWWLARTADGGWQLLSWGY